MKNLDEGPATRICFEALCCGNDRESAILIEQAQHAFLKEFNVLKMNLTENQFAQQRDMILLREDSNERQDQTVSQDPARQFMSMLRTGGMAAAAAWCISRPKQQQEDIKRSLKSIYPTVYNTLQNVPNTKDGAYQAAVKWTTDFEIPANKESVAVTRGNTAQSDYWDTYGEV